MQKMQLTIPSQMKKEIPMRNAILLMFVVPLMAALISPQAVASEHQHARAKARTAAIKQFRNSNAYAAPADIAVQPTWWGYDGALGAGIAGH
jgi:Tfp pilus assembly protein FimT